MDSEMAAGPGRSQDFQTTEHVGYCDPTTDAAPNPGMGLVCYGYSDHMFIAGRQAQEARPLDRETFDRAASLPHSDHLYLRYEWRDVQTEAGKIVIPPAWQWALDHAEAQGKGWSFRIMPTMPHSAHAHSIPDFLVGKFAMHAYDTTGRYAGPETKYCPAYDEEYLKWWGEMLGLLAERFDDHPLLEFVDVSGFGAWGEWHSRTHDQLDDGVRAHATRRLLEDHLAAFRKTPAAIGAIPSKHEDLDALFIDAIRRGCWMRRDSFYPDYTAWEYRLNAELRRPGTALVYELACHPDSVWSESDAPEMSYERIFQPLLDVGSSYIAMGFNPWHAIITHEQFDPMLRRVSGRIGYRIRPAMVFLKRVAKPEAKWITVGLVNDGVAAPAGTLTLTATFADGPTVARTLPPGWPPPGRMHLVDLDLPQEFDRFGDGNSFALELSIKIGDKPARPVRWAVAAEAAEDPNRRIVRFPAPYAFE